MRSRVSACVVLTAFLATVCLSGCYSAPIMPPTGIFYNDTKAPMNPGAKDIGSKSGRATTTSWFGLVSTGDCSFDAAAKNGGIAIDVDQFVGRLQAPDNGRVAMSLAQAGFPRVLDLLGTYAAGASDLTPWLEDAIVNRDRNLRLMYLAGLGLNEYIAEDIYEALLEFKRFPDELFTGSPGRLEVLRQIMQF